LFEAVSSTAPRRGELAGAHGVYRECTVQIGFDEASVVDLPGIHSLHHLEGDDLLALKYLLWGDERPVVSMHERSGPPVPFAAPDVIIQVVDAGNLQSHLELTLELAQLDRPIVLALNRMDEAAKKGLYVNVRALEQLLGIPVLPTVALMGQGLTALFDTAVKAAREAACPLPQPPSPHIAQSLRRFRRHSTGRRSMPPSACRIPCCCAVRGGRRLHRGRAGAALSATAARIARSLRAAAGARAAAPLAEELHADRHHRAASLVEAAQRWGAPGQRRGWRFWLDELFLHPQWGLIGSLAVFAAVLFVVFEISGWIDSMTTVRLAEAVFADWQPQATGGVVGRAVVDGLIGLTGIVVPYMIPLVILLVSLEQAGLMQRIAFVVDRGFHQIGLHGGVAVPFLLGLGCNVPAISGVARITRGRERRDRLGADHLRALFGPLRDHPRDCRQVPRRRRRVRHVRADPGPDCRHGPPAVAPQARTRAGPGAGDSCLCAARLAPLAGGNLGAHQRHPDHRHAAAGGRQRGAGAARPCRRRCGVNTLLTPVTVWWLGLPLALGVPILFGVLRKELSLLMIYQALGTQDIDRLLDPVQMVTLLVFLSFYIPCISTFAVMLRTVGRRDAWLSVALSVGVALLLAGVVRLGFGGLSVLAA
jgi:ferrous iron transport protein B